MKTENTEMAEMVKDMRIMMAAMLGMIKTAEEDDKNTDTRTKGVKPREKPGYVKRDQKCAQIANKWCTTRMVNVLNW